ncbi:MAG: MFS transporter [Lachnospiraceae bacterium]|nr:MFS transporter [Lachnospiraceae bacterium]MDY5522249.1 MFS transporter [Agathobacter sp.]
MKFIQQYKNLSKEIYVLFFGRIVTSMGSLIWPLLTLILKNKLGYNATTIATLTMAMSILQFPMLLLGGKLADTLNRKKIIIVCDLVTVVSYIICGLLPLSNYSIALFYIAGVFATIEGPSYDALVADLSDSESREKAYSLQYLGMNLGLVLSPTIGGLLFENYLWLAFILTGLATLSSTILIILFIKRLSVEKGNVSAYEEKRENESVFRILRERKTLILYALVCGFGGIVYAQFNYLLPLNMETLYGAKGATIFGMLTSTNAIVVIIATPLITTFLSRLMDVRKILIGESLIVLGLFGYRFVQGAMVPYFILMILFTIGEVFNTLGHQPYMTRRIPSTHWGRVNSFVNTVNGLFAGVGNIFIGKIVDVKGYDMAWLAVGVLGAVAIILVVMLNLVDKRQFGLLYGGKTQ